MVLILTPPPTLEQAAGARSTLKERLRTAEVSTTLRAAPPCPATPPLLPLVSRQARLQSEQLESSRELAKVAPEPRAPNLSLNP